MWHDRRRRSGKNGDSPGGTSCYTVSSSDCRRDEIPSLPAPRKAAQINSLMNTIIYDDSALASLKHISQEAIIDFVMKLLGQHRLSTTSLLISMLESEPQMYASQKQRFYSRNNGLFISLLDKIYSSTQGSALLMEWLSKTLKANEILNIVEPIIDQEMEKMKEVYFCPSNNLSESQIKNSAISSTRAPYAISEAGAQSVETRHTTRPKPSPTHRNSSSETRSCSFAHSSKDFKPSAPSDLIFCVAFTAANSHSLAASHLFSSTDFFNNDRKVEDLGIGARNAKGVVAFAIVSKMKDTTPANHGEMLLFVSVDALTWAKAKFPHASSAKLRENGYTIVESSTHSLGVDVVLQDTPIGTFFVESLKDTNRNEAGFVDFESIFGIEGVGLANVVLNAEEVRARHACKQLQTRITFDDGSSWRSIRPPRTGPDGKKTECDGENEERCSVHLHSVTTPHNFGRIFSSPAPGLVMGVGSIGPSLAMYSDSDTMLSTDAGLSWRVVQSGAHKYEFGDSGSVLVLVDDEEPTDRVKYSLDLGKTWNEFTSKVAKLTIRQPKSLFVAMREPRCINKVSFVNVNGRDRLLKCDVLEHHVKPRVSSLIEEELFGSDDYDIDAALYFLTECKYAEQCHS